MGLARGSRSHAEHTLPYLALQVKEALREAQPLSKWRTVIAYQNACLNASHELDDESEAFYMSPGLLSNALFRRDFPLGVDKRMCAAYCPRHGPLTTAPLTTARLTKQ